MKNVNGEIMDFYNKRYQAYQYHELKEDESMNIIDLLVHHNKKCEASGNTKAILGPDEIVGDLMAFNLAGLDTSLQASTTALCKLSRDHPEWIEKIRNDGVETDEQIFKNESLGLVIKETLRMYSPTPSGFFRVMLKDYEIAGVNLPKGCLVMVPGNINRFHPYWINPTEFRPERF